MCKYTIKHYWDDETAEATIEPKWITSAGDLNAEQLKVKELAKKLLSSTNYNHLSRDKPQSEIVDGFEITYSYRDKKDPHVSRDRMVTDITICITKKVNYLPYIIAILAITMIFIGFKFFKAHTEQKSAISKEKPKQSNYTVVTNVRSTEKTVKVQTITTPLCNMNEFKFINPDKCWQHFVVDKCKKNISISYDQWLQNQHPLDCTGVSSLGGDNDYNTFIKSVTDKKIKHNLTKFMEGK